MRPFHERPPEVAALLNPAFCGVLVFDAAKGFAKEADGHPLPLVLLPFLLPLALHSATRTALPTSTRTKMRAWLLQNPQFLVSFAERARSLYPFATQGFLFAAARGHLVLSSNGGVVAAKKLSARGFEPSVELAECRHVATFVGRWLATAGTTLQIYSMWRVTP